MGFAKPTGRLTRREVLRLGGAFSLALTLPDLFRAQAQSPRRTGGTFGQDATGVTLTGLRSLSNGTSASSFTLPNLHLGFGLPCPT